MSAAAPERVRRQRRIALNLLRLPEAADMLGVSLSTVRRLVDGGWLRVVRLSPGRVAIDSAELDRYVRAQAAAGGELLRAHWAAAAGEPGEDSLALALARATRLAGLG
jgi:excisionase family DNA binding protein